MKWPMVSWIFSSSSSSSFSSSFSSQYNNDDSYDQTLSEDQDNEELEQQQSDDVSYKPENDITGSVSPSIQSPGQNKDINFTNIINSPPLKRRRLTKRNIWTQEDELELLHGFSDYVKTAGNHQNDIVSFYDHVKPEQQLKQRFNKSQLVDKLRRLRRKYYNIASKINSGNEFSFRNSHEKTIFVISNKIWANIEVDQHSSRRLQNIVKEIKCEENVENIIVFGERIRKKKVLNDGSSLNNNEEIFNGSTTTKEGMILGNLDLNSIPLLGFGGSTNKFGDSISINRENMGDEKWRKQQIQELEVYSKRLELVQDRVEAALDELKSMGGS